MLFRPGPGFERVAKFYGRTTDVMSNMVGREGFEPPKAFRQLIYSQPPLAAWVPPRTTCRPGTTARYDPPIVGTMEGRCQRRPPLLFRGAASLSSAVREEKPARARAAVNVDHRPRDVVGGPRRHKQHRRGDVLRQAHPPPRNVGHERLPVSRVHVAAPADVDQP